MARQSFLVRSFKGSNPFIPKLSTNRKLQELPDEATIKVNKVLSRN